MSGGAGRRGGGGWGRVGGGSLQRLLRWRRRDAAAGCSLRRCAAGVCLCVEYPPSAPRVIGPAPCLTPPYRSKCKLYRYDNDSGEWKERGVGQGRILQHKANRKIRFLMRQDKTLKIRSNHISECVGGGVGGWVCRLLGERAPLPQLRPR